MSTHTSSQRYLSSRGGSYGCSFEEVVLQGLASDGGLFLPENVPKLPSEWSDVWPDWSFEELAFQIFSLYISPSEIPSKDLREIVRKSYSSSVFRAPEVTPLVTVDEEKQLHLLELFHGPTFAFKDVALQFLGNLFEYFLVRRNQDKKDEQREHLTVIGATSGDTGSAAIYGLRGKKDVSIIIMHPENRISPIQEAQMTSVLDPNVHNLAVNGTFDDCQDFVKALFGDADIKKTHKLAAINSINWARILAQITYYFHAHASLLKSRKLTPGVKVRFVVPTGNFGDVLAGYFAKRMGLNIEKLVVATNENDILDRFWKTGYYEKKPVHGQEAKGGFVEEVSKLMRRANFERLLWFLAFDVYGIGTVDERRKTAGQKVKKWLNELKSDGGFGVEAQLLDAAKATFESERISDKETLVTIRKMYSIKTPAGNKNASNGTAGIAKNGGYILDPHSAIGIAASYRSSERAPPPDTHHVSLATAHPAKFSKAVELALDEEEDFRFQDLLPAQFHGLEALPRRKTTVKKSDGIEGLRSLIRARVPSSQH